MSEMAAPESISAWYLWPACIVTVGQSVMWAIVMVSSPVSPLHDLVVGEGTPSLNHHLRTYRCYLNCSNLMVDRQL